MVESQRPEDIAVYNERSLKALDRAIALSQGEFSLVLVRCNYQRLRERMLHQLRELSEQRYTICELVLPESVKTLYTTIQTYVHGGLGDDNRDSKVAGNFCQSLILSPLRSVPSPLSQGDEPHNNGATGSEPPPALFILGLESVVALDDLLTSTNQVRDEFRKRLPCPLVLWVNDEVLQKLVRFAPDFASWAATPIKFEIATSQLIDFLRQRADALFKIVLSGDRGRYAPWRICMHHSTLNLATGCRSRLELDSALKELQSRGQVIDPQLEASLQFVFGQYDYASDQIDSAVILYQQSLRFWRVSNNLERQGVLLFYIGLCYCRLADLDRAQKSRNWEEAWPYLLQCVDVFTQAGRQDLVAQFITQLAEVLQRLEAWDSLEMLGHKSLTLHQTYRSEVQLAQDYGFLAEVSLFQSRWADASQFAEQALSILATVSGKPDEYQGLHQFLLTQLYQLFLVKSQRQLGQLPEAQQQLETASLELTEAIASSEHRYEPQRYLYLLERLRAFYFEQAQYLEAFQIKQEQRAIEQLYGFRAFMGAGRLQPQRLVTNPTLAPVEHSEIVAQEIAASGRQQDVNRLIERMMRADHKVTVIHGQSGVGKSSIVYAGLVPALKYRALGDRIAVPVVLKVYTDWVRELAKALAEALNDFGWSEGEDAINLGFNEIQTPKEKTQFIIGQLRENAEHNLLTILIFDQFEEFLFGSINQSTRIVFYEFLRDCLNLPFVKVIFSIREDYLHYLLEIEQFNLEVIDNNILDKKIRYPLGNFSVDDAHSVIQSLTERAHFYLEPALIDELVRDLASELGTVRPIELQVVGAQLQAENITTLAQYQQRGPKEKLVEQYLKEVVKDCGPENEQAAWLVLYLLTDENDNRPLKTGAELAVESGIESQKLDLILEILEKSGLLFLLPEVPANRYQLVHDYLVEFIRQRKQLNIQTELEELRKKDKVSQDKIEQLRAELREKELRAELAKATEIQRSTEDKLNRVLQRSLQEARLVGVALATLTIIAGAMGIRAAIGETNAQLRELNASSQALAASNREFEALLKSLRAGRQLKRSLGVTADTRTRVITALQQTVYGVRERNRLEGHTGWVSSVSFSPDGQTLASASADNTVKLWNADGSLVNDLTSHKAGVYSVSFSPDGQMLATGSEDKTVRLWRSDGVLLRTLEGHRDRVYSVSFSPNGQTLASASWDKTVKLWSKEGTLLKTLTGHQDHVMGVSFSPNGRLIASVSFDHTLKLWTANGVLLKTWKPHNQRVLSVAFSPDSQIIATGSADNTVKLWRTDGRLIDTLKGHSNWVLSVNFSPDGQKLATGSADNTVKLWQAADGALIDTLQGHGNLVQGVSFSPDGQTVASASADNTIKLWRSDGGMLRPMQVHRKPVSSVSFSPDGKMIATSGWDNMVKLWSKSGVLIKAFQAHSKPVSSVSFSPDGKVIATASWDSTIKLWKTDGSLRNTLKGHRDRVTSVTFSPNGKMIASASQDRTVKLWTADGTLLNTLEGHNAEVWGVSFSPDSKMIASASNDGTVNLWSRDGELVNTLKGHNGSVNWVSFSPDGQLIASASNDGTVNLWRRRDGKLHRSLKGHNGWVNWVSFSPDGKLIASASEDKTVNLWSLDGNLINTLEGHSDAVFGVSFSPDGKLLASASRDTTMILWNLDLDDLLNLGCSWLDDYLDNPSHWSVSETSPSESQALCNGVKQVSAERLR